MRFMSQLSTFLYYVTLFVGLGFFKLLRLSSLPFTTKSYIPERMFPLLHNEELDIHCTRTQRSIDHVPYCTYHWSSQKIAHRGDIILFPGFNQNVNTQYAYFITRCLRQGYHVWSLDYPGHGHVTGSHRQIDISEATLYTLSMNCIYLVFEHYHFAPDTNIHFVGFSMGSLLGMQLKNVLERNVGSGPSNVVFALISIRSWTCMSPVLLSVHKIMWNTVLSLHPLLSRWSGKPLWTFSNPKDDREYQADAHITKDINPTFKTLCCIQELVKHALEALPNLSVHNTLFIHGGKDTIMPLDKLLSLLNARLQQKQVFDILWFPQFSHSMLYGVSDEEKQVITDCILDFIKLKGSQNQN